MEKKSAIVASTPDQNGAIIEAPKSQPARYREVHIDRIEDREKELHKEIMAYKRPGAGALAALQAQKKVAIEIREKTCSKVLDEDVFTAAVEKIIERDYFPDLAALNGHNPQDSKSSIVSLEVDDRTLEPKEDDGADEEDAGTDLRPLRSVDTKDMRLDSFMRKYTSEDNAAFSGVMLAEKKVREGGELRKHFRDRELKYLEHHKNMLALTGTNAAKVNKPGSSYLGWDYAARSNLMFNPDGVLSLEADKLDVSQRAPKVINRENTRVDLEVYHKQLTVPQEIKGELVVNPDDVLNTPSRSELEDASFAPGMTWGEVAATPIRVNAGPPPKNAFKVPQQTGREVVAHRLAQENIAKKRNKQRMKARDRSADGKIGLSPAASALLKRNTPSRASSGVLGSTPNSILRSTSMRFASPFVSPSPRRPSATPTRIPNKGSITDNLL